MIRALLLTRVTIRGSATAGQEAVVFLLVTQQCDLSRTNLQSHLRRSVDNKSYTTISPKLLHWKTENQKTLPLVAHVFFKAPANQLDFS